MSKVSSRKLQERKKRARAMARQLKKLFPEAKIALRYKNNWQLVVAVILSAQTTDKKVNEVTPVLFKKYKTLNDYVTADPKAFAKAIREIGLWRAKAKNILATAKIVHEKHGGKVPRTMKELIALHGIGRKTANVILGNVYGIVDGIAVDTHVRRFALRFDLTDSKNPVKIEQDLMQLLPKEEWFTFTYRIIEYGRQICPAQRHDCSRHPLTKLWPKAAERWFSAR